MFPGQHDTPLPQLQDLARLDASSKDKTAIKSFIALCTLTQILESTLQYIYDLGQRNIEKSYSTLDHLQVALTNWCSSLDTDLSFVNFENGSVREGLLNLHISYLAIAQLIARLQLDNAHHQQPVSLTLLQTYRQKSFTAAAAIVAVITNLPKNALDAFWLPYTAYHLTSTGILLLRLSLLKPDSTNNNLAAQSLALASKLFAFLRSARDDHGWDLAEVCLTQCEPYYTYRTSNLPVSTKKHGRKRKSRKSEDLRDKNYSQTSSASGNTQTSHENSADVAHDPILPVTLSPLAERIPSEDQTQPTTTSAIPLDNLFPPEEASSDLIEPSFDFDPPADGLFPDLWTWDVFDSAP